ncbi:MAG: hypothetical protein RL095_475 [Verrucomicrobiota bacterium]|jgi:hypothetical protein
MSWGYASCSYDFVNDAYQMVRSGLGKMVYLQVIGNSFNDKKIFEISGYYARPSDSRPVTRLCRKYDPNLPRQGDTTDNFVRYTPRYAR